MRYVYKEIRTGQLFVEQQFISNEQLDNALAKADCRLGEWLLKEKIINREQLARVLAQYYQLEYFDLDGFKVEIELFNYLPMNQAIRLNVVPIRLANGTLVVCVANLDDYNLEQKLEAITGKKIRLVMADAEEIDETLNRSDGSSHLLNDLTQDFKASLIKEGTDGKRQIIGLDGVDGEQAPIIRLINSIIINAIKKRTSDIHIEAFDKRIDVKYRIDGVLYDATEKLDVKYHSSLITRLKVMSELDIAEKRIPQDGRFKLRVANHDIDFRVSILPTIFGEDVVIRILDKLPFRDGTSELSIKSLNLDADTDIKFRRAIHEPYGMVLMTGPTGSGKTTTLYAALSDLYTGEEKIITIEDPVEYELDGIIQIPVNNKKGLTFAKGLRSILRHDPDKIMVGEIRDAETAQIAVQSALTGHLVFTTVHANNSFDVISRFTHMGVDLYSFVSALNCVMAQRLIRRICRHCKKTVKIDKEYLDYSGLDSLKYVDYEFYVGEGCSECSQTGYHGRMAITELLPISDKIRELILNERNVSELHEVAKQEGMTSLRQSAINKAMAGETTLKEVNRVTFID